MVLLVVRRVDKQLGQRARDCVLLHGATYQGGPQLEVEWQEAREGGARHRIKE